MNKEKIKELIDIRLKVINSNEKLIPINIIDKCYSSKKGKNSLINNNSNLPPIKQQINPNNNCNLQTNQNNLDLNAPKIEKEKEIDEEGIDNKSTKTSFNITENLFNFKNGLNNNINKQENKEQLKTIKETSPESKISLRNLEFVRKMSEKVKKGREEKIMLLNKPRQSPMERFNNIKKYFQVKSSSGSPRSFNHKKFEFFSESKEGKNVKKLFNNDNIYYYEIIYGGNSSEVIEECLKKRNQWKIYSKTGEEFTQNYNNIYAPTNININTSPTNSSTKFNNQAYMSFNNLYIYSNSNQNENNPLPNFIWSHSSTRLDFSEFSKYRPAHIKKMTNHFEFHKEITNKMNLFLNMMIYSESCNLDLFSMVPLTFPIRYESQNYINEISSFIHIFNNINKYIDSDIDNLDIDLKKNTNNNYKYKYRNLFDLELRGRIGYRTPLHIPKSHYSGRNLWLVKAIDLNRGRCIKISDNINGIESIIKHFYKGMKKSFFRMVTKEMIDDEEKENQKNEGFSKINNHNNNKEEINEILDNNNKNNKTLNSNINNNIGKYKENINIKKNMHIIKKNKLTNNKVHLPFLSTSNNILNDTNDLKGHQKDKSRNILEKNTKQDLVNNNSKIVYTNIMKGRQILKQNNPQVYQNSTIIIQKYIEKPLCYNGRKCDMRLWVMLTWDFNLYLFKEGHFKATSLPYDVNSQDSYVHLTNYSVQKNNKNFAKFETGNEISFSDFECSLDNKINVRKDLLPKVKEIIIHSLKSVCGKINKLERKMCFEIFGYDFMFDENYNPFLLEVNTNPGLEISSPLIEMLIPRMIDDAFKITIDKVFILNEKNVNKMKEKPYKVSGYDDNENMWELLTNIIN